MTCACPRIDARNCYIERYGLGMVELLAPDDPRVADDETCECDCHHTDDDLEEP